MTAKHSVIMAQPNFRYGDNVFIPYSVGSLQAYAETLPEVRENFHFGHPLFVREDPREVIGRCEKPAIVCFSAYLWNWEYNQALAQAMRATFPDCLIVFGGTQVPNNSVGFFEQYPYIDLLVHHEGELVFAQVLREFLSRQPDYTKIAGLSVRVESNRTLKTRAGERIRDLSQLPSPYLAGVFDFMLGRSFVLNASQETNRGCPYKCTFCDWGGNTYDKIFVMPEDRVIEEFEWFGHNGVEYIFNCDANYGIMPRDIDLTEKMVAISRKHGGYPAKFRMCTAKNSNDKIFAISKMLNDAGMSKGATLSFQSMDAHTLEIVKRKNIGIEVFSTLMGQYRAAGIATYTELILGMPGESYQSTKQGVDSLLDSQADAVNLFVYVCSVLPNSEMSEPAYVAKHQIKSVRMPILLAHSTPEPESFDEYQEVVIETATMPNADWQRAYLFYWVVQAFHCLGLVQHIAIFCRRQGDIRYSEFYERLIEHFSTEETLVGEEIALTRMLVANSMASGRLDRILPQFGEVYWPLEEATFLTLVARKESFYQEIRAFLDTLPELRNQLVVSELLDDLVRYQAAIVKDPVTEEVSLALGYDIHDYFSRMGNGDAPRRHPNRLWIKARVSYGGDLQRYAREGVWYARKGGRLHHTDVTSQPV